MRGFRIFLCVMSIFMFTFCCLAEEEEKKFNDTAEVSFVDKSGNSDTTDLYFNNLMSYKFTKNFDASWRLFIGYGQTDGEKTAENYLTEIKGNYAFNERFYITGLGGWERDEFGGIDQRYYAGPALGYKFLIGPKHFLLSELGVQYAQEDYTDGTDNDFLEGRAFGAYEYLFTETSAFKQVIEFLTDFNDSEKYKFNSETSFTAALNSWLYLKTGYKIKYNNDPVGEDIKKTDRILSATLGMAF